MKKNRILLLITVFIITISYVLYSYFSERCLGEAKVYKLELKGRVVGIYMTRIMHFKLYNGIDTVEPYGSYSSELISTLMVNDSLFKPAYNDSCYIYRQGGVGIKVIYGYSECPETERNKIKKEANK